MRQLLASCLIVLMVVTTGCTAIVGGESVSGDGAPAPLTQHPVPGQTSPGGGPDAPTTGSPSPSGSSSDRDPVITRDDLQAAGIAIIADTALPAADSGVVLTEIQAERLLVEANEGAGLRGDDLNQLAPMPEGAPPTSYFLGAWVSKAEGHAADTARRVMDRIERVDWHRANDVTVPTVVPLLMVADFARMISPELMGEQSNDSESAGTVATTVTSPQGFRRAPILEKPCTAATELLASAINGVFNALKLSAPAGDSIFDDIVGSLVSIYNYALGLAKGIVKATINTLTRPVFEILRTVTAGLGAASMLLSYLKGQQLIVSIQPDQIYRLAVGSEPAQSGRFAVRAVALSKDWPAPLVDCLKVAGGKFPELMLPGATATWKLVEPPDRPGLLVPESLTTTVGSDNRAYLNFSTDSEPEEYADGPVMESGPIVFVEVEQKRVSDFLNSVEKQVTSQLTNAILSFIPIDAIRTVVAKVIDSVLGPITKLIRKEIEGTANGIFMMRGQLNAVRVTYHEPPPPKVTKTSGPAGESGDFCAGFLETLRWGQRHMPSDGSLAAWGAELERRFKALRPLVPYELTQELVVMTLVYALVGVEAGAAALGSAIAENDFPGAAQRIAAYCHINPSEIPGFG